MTSIMQYDPVDFPTIHFNAIILHETWSLILHEGFYMHFFFHSVVSSAHECYMLDVSESCLSFVLAFDVGMCQ
jgi:hypothetical protein